MDRWIKWDAAEALFVCFVCKRTHTAISLGRQTLLLFLSSPVFAGNRCLCYGLIWNAYWAENNNTLSTLEYQQWQCKPLSLPSSSAQRFICLGYRLHPSPVQVTEGRWTLVESYSSTGNCGTSYITPEDMSYLKGLCKSLLSKSIQTDLEHHIDLTNQTDKSIQLTKSDQTYPNRFELIQKLSATADKFKCLN